MSHSFAGLMGLGGGPKRHATRAVGAIEEAQMSYALAESMLNKLLFSADPYKTCQDVGELVARGDVAFGKAVAHVDELLRLKKERWVDADAATNGMLEQAYMELNALQPIAEAVSGGFRKICLTADVRDMQKAAKKKASGQINGYRRR